MQGKGSGGPPVWVRVLVTVIFAAGIAGALTGISLLFDGGGDRSDRQEKRTKKSGELPVPTNITVDGADADTKRDDNITLSPAAKDVVQDARKAPERFDIGGDLRGKDNTAAGVIEPPLAAQEWPGCRTAFVRAFSQRNGAPIRAIAVHYTAGGNLPGWADLLGLTAYSNNITNEVSWHFGIDREGNCIYNVPTRYKAWTIGNLNRTTVNIEGVGTGREPDYLGPGFKRLSSVVRRIGRLHNVPIRLGAVDGNCNITRSGIITHWMGGTCSGGHIDIKPYNIEKVVARIAADACGPKCKRAKRGERHVVVHRRSRELRCSHSAFRARHPESCRKLLAENRQLHKAGL